MQEYSSKLKVSTTMTWQSAHWSSTQQLLESCWCSWSWQACWHMLWMSREHSCMENLKIGKSYIWKFCRALRSIFLRGVSYYCWSVFMDSSSQQKHFGDSCYALQVPWDSSKAWLIPAFTVHRRRDGLSWWCHGSMMMLLSDKKATSWILRKISWTNSNAKTADLWMSTCDARLKAWDRRSQVPEEITIEKLQRDEFGIGSLKEFNTPATPVTVLKSLMKVN